MLRHILLALSVCVGLVGAGKRSKKQKLAERLDPGYECFICQITTQVLFKKYSALSPKEQRLERSVVQLHEAQICKWDNFKNNRGDRVDDARELINQCELQQDRYQMEDRFDRAVLRPGKVWDVPGIMAHMCGDTGFCKYADKQEEERAVLAEAIAKGEEQGKALIATMTKEKGYELDAHTGLYRKVLDEAEKGEKGVPLASLRKDGNVLLSFSIRNAALALVGQEESVVWNVYAPSADVPIGMGKVVKAMSLKSHYAWIMPPDQMWGEKAYQPHANGPAVGAHEYCVLEINVLDHIMGATALNPEWSEAEILQHLSDLKKEKEKEL